MIMVFHFKYVNLIKTHVIRKQLLDSNYSFKEELIQFIEVYFHPTDNTVNKWEGSTKRYG